MANMASACALVIANDSKMFGTIHSWRAKEAASTCVLVTISAVCICIMVVCGVMLAREYSLAKGYERTTCTVMNVTYTGGVQSCPVCTGYKDKSKDKGSTGSCITSYFPCVRVMVTYSIDWVNYEALLHRDSLQATGLYRECSFNICLKDRDDNLREVDKYAAQWRSMRGQRLDCFYNTANNDDVIMHKTYSLSDVVHSMFWPSLVIVICAMVFLHLETRRRKLTFCGRQEDDDVIGSSPSRKSTPETIDGLETQVILRDDRLGHYGGGGVHCKLVSARPSVVSLRPALVSPRLSLTVADRPNWKIHSSMVNVASSSSSNGQGHSPSASSAFDELKRIELKRRSLDAVTCHSCYPPPPSISIPHPTIAASAAASSQHPASFSLRFIDLSSSGSSSAFSSPTHSLKPTKHNTTTTTTTTATKTTTTTTATRNGTVKNDRMEDSLGVRSTLASK